METFGRTLRMLRREKKLTLDKVASKSEISIPYLSALERGQRTPPEKSIVSKLARAVGAKGDMLKELQRLAEDENREAKLSRDIMKNVPSKRRHLMVQMARRTDPQFWKGVEELLDESPQSESDQSPAAIGEDDRTES